MSVGPRPGYGGVLAVMKSIYRYFLNQPGMDKPFAVFSTIMLIGFIFPAAIIVFFILWTFLLEIISMILFGTIF